MTLAFSVLNSSTKTIELLPPQIELDATTKDKHRNGIKSEPVPVKNYQLTSRKLMPHARTDGIVVFRRPSFKESRDRLLLHIAQTDAVDRPVVAAIAFVPQEEGASK